MTIVSSQFISGGLGVNDRGDSGGVGGGGYHEERSGGGGLARREIRGQHQICNNSQQFTCLMYI